MGLAKREKKIAGGATVCAYFIFGCFVASGTVRANCAEEIAVCLFGPSSHLQPIEPSQISPVINSLSVAMGISPYDYGFPSREPVVSVGPTLLESRAPFLVSDRLRGIEEDFKNLPSLQRAYFANIHSPALGQNLRNLDCQQAMGQDLASCLLQAKAMKKKRFKWLVIGALAGGVALTSLDLGLPMLGLPAPVNRWILFGYAIIGYGLKVLYPAAKYLDSHLEIRSIEKMQEQLQQLKDLASTEPLINAQRNWIYLSTTRLLTLTPQNRESVLRALDDSVHAKERAFAKNLRKSKTQNLTVLVDVFYGNISTEPQAYIFTRISPHHSRFSTDQVEAKAEEIFPSAHALLDLF